MALGFSRPALEMTFLKKVCIDCSF
uniref:Uncharacterized protein n=1 Tax=Arundo donax TaxID=35708 RepID=A0A0A9FUC5_ARUDO